MVENFQRDALVEISSVTKQYGDLKAVDDVDLEIRPGEIFALLGPNGAGKTTLIGCITGLISAFSGSIDVAGFDVVDDYRLTRRLIGLVPQELNYDAFFNVRQVLEFQAGYFGERPSKDEIDELLEQFDLLEKEDANTRWLSGGMKRRLMICKALVHDPVLLFLDEPTAGVDVGLRDELWKYVRRLRDQGMTIVLTTHYLEEAEMLCRNVAVINHGEIVEYGTVGELLHKLHVETFVLTVAGNVDRLEPIPGYSVRVRADGGLEVEVPKDQGVNRLFAGLAEQGIEVLSMRNKANRLEEFFLRLVEHQGAPGRAA